ncbi:hypothetical protein SMAC4_13593 [Sordaria macrospora]|uniref:uncharacterized protein n=1 Tax=Sordaria macrospora TaxID=5147 RepID=UPI002B288D2E|nr:hypothetical protein SMAC4_13593 [Sordaria macrospora]
MSMPLPSGAPKPPPPAIIPVTPLPDPFVSRPAPHDGAVGQESPDCGRGSPSRPHHHHCHHHWTHLVLRRDCHL